MNEEAPLGLTSREAERRLAQYGPNEVTRRAGPGQARELARQFAHPLALLLWAAAGLAVAAGNATLAGAIVAVIVLNALLAFAQEAQAERATEALGELLPPQVRVRRDGRVAEVDAAALVPGDLVLIAEGDRISADATLTGGALEVDMSPLTGESQPVNRHDLGTDTVPALALGREPGEPGIMERPPRPRKSGIIQRSMLARAWLRMGLVEACLAMIGFFVVLLAAGWSWGAPTGAGTPLHHAYLQATSMTWAGIVAGQIGAGFAARTTTASLWQIGVFTNRHLLRGVVFELAFGAAIIYLPPLQSLFHTAGLDFSQLALPATFPFLVWGVDEAWRAWRRRQSGMRRTHMRAAPEYG